MNTQKLLFEELKRSGAPRSYLFTAQHLLNFKTRLSPPEQEELSSVIKELCDTGFFKEDGGLRLTDKGYGILWNI